MNRGNTLRETVSAIFEFATEPYELIIVDNGSTDEPTLSLLTELEGAQDHRCTVIRNETNQGLSVATNQGLMIGRYDTLIHMDDDAVIRRRGWNQAFHEFLIKHPEVGIAAPDRGPVGSIAHEGFTEVRWFLGMVWALRRSIFEEIGGYDEQLQHQQECDMCLRVRLHGYLAAQCPHVPIQDVIHNDPGGPRSEISLAREDFGTVQFCDKWAQYFLGRGRGYKDCPRYLMAHYPPDLEFLERVAGQPFNGEETLVLNGVVYYVFKTLRTENAFMEPRGSDRYAVTQQEIVARWKALTGEDYTGYDWGRVPYALPGRELG
jgi:glycosyltransferase involved in cell wall biosynthesis